MSQDQPLVKLDEILTERKESPHLSQLASGEIKVISKIGFKNGEIEFRVEGSTKTKMILIMPGDLVVSGINAAKGAIALYGEEANSPASATIHYSSYKINKCKANPMYLWWYFRSEDFVNILAKNLPNGIKTELKPKKLLSLRIPLPNIKVQDRIVNSIESINSKLLKVKYIDSKMDEKLWAWFLSSLNKTFTSLGKKYPSKPLDRLVDKTRGISYGIVQTGNHFEGGIPTLRAGDLGWFNVNIGAVKEVSPEIEAKYCRTRLVGDELLLRIRGGLGEVAIFPKVDSIWNVSREIAVIPFTSEVIPEYGMYALAAPVSQDFMTDNVRGTAYKGINLTDVRRLEIAVPPEQVQVETVTKFKTLYLLLNKLKLKRKGFDLRLESLSTSIRSHVFRNAQ